MRVQPFSYLEQLDKVGPAPPAALPQQSNILLHYEDPNTNVSGNTWSDISALGVTTGIIAPGALVDATSNSLQVNTSSSRNQYFRVTTTQNMDIKSLVIIHNLWENSTTTGTSREYFLDMRKSGNTNSGYFNQFDSVDSNPLYLFANDGEYYSYDETDGFMLSAQLTTQANLTNGTGNNLGGNGTDQWMGPNGRLAYLPKRMWLFNFNTNMPIGLYTSGLRGLVFGANDSLTEGSNLGIFSIVGWSVALSASEAADALNYFKSQGILT